MTRPSGSQAVRLRDWTEADVDAMVALRNDLPMQRLLMASARGETREQVRQWLQSKREAADTSFLVVARLPDDRAIGYIQAAAIDHDAGIADLGVCIAAAERGKGHGRQACLLFHEHMRDVLGLRRVRLRVLALNHGACALYRSLGYRVTATLAGGHLHEGQPADVLVMERDLPP